jgi:hypothetical protein
LLLPGLKGAARGQEEIRRTIVEIAAGIRTDSRSKKHMVGVVRQWESAEACQTG